MAGKKVWLARFMKTGNLAASWLRTASDHGDELEEVMVASKGVRVRLNLRDGSHGRQKSAVGPIHENGEPGSQLAVYGI